MSQIQQELASGINEIAGRAVDPEENLFADAIDSLMLVEVINLIEDLAKAHGRKVNMNALISEDVLTVRDIERALG
jgi:acyl carrier protein